jgi:hypothetical protein
MKKDGLNKLKKAATKDICLEKDLYTRRKGNVDVEDKFLATLDGRASGALAVLIQQGATNISEEAKKDIARFVNTLHRRHPDFINEMREFNERCRIQGQKIAEKNYAETGEDHRHLFEKEKFDDSPAVMEYHADACLDDIMNADWEVVNNDSSFEFLTSDFPLQLEHIAGPPTHGITLPEKFLLLLPLTPSKILIISNAPHVIKRIKSMQIREFAKKVNFVTLKQSRNMIISSTLSSEAFILKHINQGDQSGAERNTTK